MSLYSKRTRKPSSLSLSVSSIPYSPFSPSSESTAFLSHSRNNSRSNSPHPRSPITPSRIALPLSPLPSPSPSAGELGPWTPPKSSAGRRGRCFLVTVTVGLLVLIATGAGVHKRQDLKAVWESESVKAHVDYLLDWTRPANNSEPQTENLATTTTAEVNKKEPIKISPLPRPRTPNLDDESVRYLGFLPHSGFHNQRIALENALLLGKLLNRTVLIPPVWIGWPTATLFYDDLQQAWNTMMQITPSSFALPPESLDTSSPLFISPTYNVSSTLYPLPGAEEAATARKIKMEQIHRTHAAHYKSLGWEIRPDHYPITNYTEKDCKSYSVECRHTYKDTFLAWDFLGDLDRVEREEGVGLVDRWDLREKSLEEMLKVKEEDVYVLRDEQNRDFQFVDDPNATPLMPLISPNDPTGSFHRTVSLSKLSQLPQKVLLIGSLFSSSRVKSRTPATAHARALIGQSMAFRNPYLLNPVDAISTKLGGVGNFYGVHARLGDGEFKRFGERNMESVWRKLVRGVGVDESFERTLWEKGLAERIVRGWGQKVTEGMRKVKRGEMEVQEEMMREWSWLDGSVDDTEDEEEETTSIPRRHQRRSPPSKRAPLPLSLKCRSPLHTNPSLQALNTPLYLATDARTPLSSPELLPFFSTFPCTFILSDFTVSKPEINGGEVVEQVDEMMRLENENDGVPLGRLFLPFLEAIVAAKGGVVVGTPGSTFSAFAEGSLHDAYMKDVA